VRLLQDAQSYVVWERADLDRLWTDLRFSTRRDVGPLAAISDAKVATCGCSLPGFTAVRPRSHVTETRNCPRNCPIALQPKERQAVDTKYGGLHAGDPQHVGRAGAI